ncbi:MAG: hypothetical protein ACRDRX_13955 [Pseudonocardiaceae bacterium]
MTCPAGWPPDRAWCYCWSVVASSPSTSSRPRNGRKPPASSAGSRNEYRPRKLRWRSPLRRTYHTRREPIIHDLPSPLPRPEQYPDYAPPVTIDQNWPSLYRPPPKPVSPPAPACAVDPDETAAFLSALADPSSLPRHGPAGCWPRWC